MIKKILYMFIMVLLPMGGHAAVFTTPLTAEEIQAKLAALPERGKSQTKAVLHSDLGTVYFNQGQFAMAAQELEKTFEYDTSRRLRRHAYLYLGRSYESLGRLDKAMAAYEQAVANDKRNWKRHRDLAMTFETVKLYDKAVLTYKRALHYNSKAPDVHFLLGRTYRKMGFYEKAEDRLKTAISLGLDDSVLERELSLVYEGQGRFKEATQALINTLSASSALSDWARMIYLSSLSNNPVYVDQGLNFLKKERASKETQKFYTELVQCLRPKPSRVLTVDVSDPTLTSLIDSITNK
jgi:tetratricopeptide (TPR) repeat protein